MDEQAWKRLRGLKHLLHEGVERGSVFVEEHHRHAAAKPFRLIGSFTLFAGPTRAVRLVHDGVLTLSYGSIRLLNRAAERADSWLLDTLESADEDR